MGKMVEVGRQRIRRARGNIQNMKDHEGIMLKNRPQQSDVRRRHAFAQVIRFYQKTRANGEARHQRSSIVSDIQNQHPE